MPHSTTWERNGVCWEYWGVVTGEELLRSNQEIYGDRRFDTMSYQVVDLTRVERFDVTPDDMIGIAANDRAAALTNADVLVAVAASDEIIRQLSALYEKESGDSPWEHRIFESVSDARAWLSGEDSSVRR